jgi:exopolysaccharide biosynthesis protein
MINEAFFYKTEPIQIKPGTANGVVGSTESLGDIANDLKAIAAINGTYFAAYDPKDLQPFGTLMTNGTFEHYEGGKVLLGFTKDNDLVFGRNDDVTIRGRRNGSSVWPNDWYAWAINHLPTTSGSIVIFTPAFRSRTISLPNYRFIVVDDNVVTDKTSDSATIPDHGFVIAFDNVSNNQRYINNFKNGDTVDYTVNLPKGFENVVSAMSGGPKLVTDGSIDEGLSDLSAYDSTIYARQTRPFIGTNSDHKVVIGTVSNVTARDLAQIVKNLGLVNAMSLDGGASAGLYYNGQYLTKPGRKLSNAIVIVRK